MNPMRDAIVVMGDLNTDVYQEIFAGEQTVPLLVRAGFHNLVDQLPPAQRTTIPAKEGDLHDYPDATFDYILSSHSIGQVPIQIIQDGVPKIATSEPGLPGHASDHYMLEMQLSGLKKYRRWTTTKGKWVEARYISGNEDEVILQDRSGKIRAVPLKALREEDREYVGRQNSLGAGW